MHITYKLMIGGALLDLCFNFETAEFKEIKRRIENGDYTDDDIRELSATLWGYIKTSKDKLGSSMLQQIPSVSAAVINELMNNYRLQNGENAVQAATKHSCDQILTHLLTHPNAATAVNDTDNGIPALIQSVTLNTWGNECYKLLTEQPKTNLNITDENGNTALMHAIAHSSNYCSKDLLQRDVDVDKQNNKNETALIYAAKKNNASIVAKITEKCTKETVQQEDERAFTALHYAIMQVEPSHQKFPVVAILTANGALKGAEAKTDKTALELAKAGGNDKLIEFLFKELGRVNLELAKEKIEHAKTKRQMSQLISPSKLRSAGLSVAVLNGDADKLERDAEIIRKNAGIYDDNSKEKQKEIAEKEEKNKAFCCNPVFTASSKVASIASVNAEENCGRCTLCGLFCGGFCQSLSQTCDDKIFKTACCTPMCEVATPIVCTIATVEGCINVANGVKNNKVGIAEDEVITGQPQSQTNQIRGSNVNQSALNQSVGFSQSDAAQRSNVNNQSNKHTTRLNSNRLASASVSQQRRY